MAKTPPYTSICHAIKKIDMHCQTASIPNDIMQCSQNYPYSGMSNRGGGGIATVTMGLCAGY